MRRREFRAGTAVCRDPVRVGTRVMSPKVARVRPSFSVTAAMAASWMPFGVMQTGQPGPETISTPASASRGVRPFLKRAIVWVPQTSMRRGLRPRDRAFSPISPRSRRSAAGFLSSFIGRTRRPFP